MVFLIVKGYFFLSQVVNDSLNPVWSQTFDFVVEDGLHDMLIVEVYDHDTFGKVKSCNRLICLLLKFHLVRLHYMTF